MAAYRHDGRTKPDCVRLGPVRSIFALLIAEDPPSGRDALIDIGLFAMLGNVEAAGLNFGVSAQAEKCS